MEGILRGIGHFERNNSEFWDFEGIGVREETKGGSAGGLVWHKGAPASVVLMTEM